MEEKLLTYIVQNWSLPSYEFDKALDGYQRCLPLKFGNPTLYFYLTDRVDDFIRDNELDSNWFFESSLGDYDELFWHLNFN